MGFIGKIREAFRVKMRDEFCAGLRQQLGIDASLAPRGRREEQVKRTGRARSLGLVDIPEGPIRWVNVQEVGGAMEDTHYGATYGVPDQKIVPTFPNVSIKSVRVRDGRVFGDVVRVDWKGNDFGLGVIERLSEYPWEALMRSAVDGTHRSSRVRLLGHVTSWPLEAERAYARSWYMGRFPIGTVVGLLSSHRAASAGNSGSMRRAS